MNQQIILLTCQESTPRQEITPLDPFSGLCTSNAVYLSAKKKQIESENQDSIPSKIDKTKDITVTEQKISRAREYCGSADHWSSNCPQEKVCLNHKTKNHSLKYSYPVMKDAKGQQKDYRGYKSDDLPFDSRTVHQVQGTVRNNQITPLVA